jgi:hypothetical protein
MQSLEPEVRTAINSIYDELVGSGTGEPAPDEPRTAAAVEHAEPTKAKPVRGVVLEFAKGCDKVAEGIEPMTSSMP